MKLKPMKVKLFKASTLLKIDRFAMTYKKGGTDYELPPFLKDVRLTKTLTTYPIL